MAQLPWQTAQGLMPWQVGQTFVDDQGVFWQAYADPASPTGYSTKRQDANGTSFQSINAPNDPNAAYNAVLNGPYGKTLTAAEAAAAQQNQFNQNLQNRTLQVSQDNSKTDQQYKQALVEQAKQDLSFKYYQQNQTFAGQQGTLGLDTLKLGASLHGPRDWDSYLQTAAAAGQNPLLQNAMGSWSSLTNVRPNTGHVAGGTPQPFDLNGLAADFMGGGGSGNGGGGGSGYTLPRDANLDAVAMGGSPAPGWWQGLSSDEQERAKGYWDKRGWSPSTVLNGLAYQSPNQGLGYSGA